MKTVKFELKAAGYCEAQHHHAVKGAKKETIRFYATYAHIEHPEHGHILFDTGYTRRFYTATKTYPFKLYAQITKVFIKETEEACQQLKEAGIAPEDIRYIIVSHFHADHIGGLRDFPNARFICSESAYTDVKNRKGVAALSRGFIPELMPTDFHERAQLISTKKGGAHDSILGSMYDLFDDGSILLCGLSGHAKGQIGALLQTDEGKIFLVSDGVWLKPNYTHLQLPHPIVRLFFDSWKDFKSNLNKIHQYHKAHPETLIIPCHCRATYEAINGSLKP